MPTATDKDWDVEATEEKEEEERDLISYKISYYPADITLDGYVEKDRKEQLLIPEFQRKYVWTIVQARKLIESFLLGLPVPGVFLYKERDTNRLMIIDGHQRIMTAIRFFKEDFADKKFRLKNVHEKWDGKCFSDLDDSDQNLLRDTVLRATIIQQMDPNDDSSQYHVFERLNTGGTNLNPMEVRKCVYFGDYFKLLEKLNLIPS